MATRSRSRPVPHAFLTTREAAGRLGVTINAVKAWIRAEQLPALRTPGGHHRIPEADLSAFQAHLAERSRGPGRARPRILLVDDDPLLLTTLRDAAAQQVPDAVVELAGDGYEALVQVGLFRPDLLVLDLRMPRLDGFEVCQRLKARPATRAVRILAITAFEGDEARERILACGADDFLEKPFDISEFRARVLTLLGRGAPR